MYKYPQVTIAADETESTPVDISNLKVIAILMPAAWTAADLIIQVSNDGETWRSPYKSDGTAANSVEADVDRHIQVDLSGLVGSHYLRLLSGAPPVEQEADRTIGLIAEVVERP